MTTSYTYELHEINRLVSALNALEDSKEGLSEEKRSELTSRQAPLLKELKSRVAAIICPW